MTRSTPTPTAFLVVCEDSGASATCPELSVGPSLPLGDEGVVLVPLGFDFDFYGVAYSTPCTWARTAP